MTPQVKLLALITLIAVGSCAAFMFGSLDDLCYRNRMESASSPETRYLIEKGWLPEWLPESATDIREAHNLDTNLVIVRYNLDPAQAEALTSNTETASSDVEISPALCGADWWDKETINRQIKDGTMPVYKKSGTRQPNSTWYIAPAGTEVFMWYSPYD